MKEILEDIGKQVIQIEPEARYEVHDDIYLMIYCFPSPNIVCYEFVIVEQFLWSTAAHGSDNNEYCACNLANPNYVKELIGYMSKWPGGGLFRKFKTNEKL